MNRLRYLLNYVAPALLLVVPAERALAAIHYVNLAGTSPAAPYTDWVTAATNIQDALDVAVAGDQVVVTNGIYATGGRVTQHGTNRVAIEGAVHVRSVNGPAVTVIKGAPSDDSAFFGLGDNGIRCAYVGAGAVLDGFTLTNGFTRIGSDAGGAFCEPSAALTNCIIINNRAGAPDNDNLAGGVYQGVLYRCWLIGNVCHGEGGGAGSSTLYDCVITGNWSADGGGGVSASTLYNCVLAGNHSEFLGGGAFWGVLRNCTLVGNSSQFSGGAYFSSVKNCIIYFNRATFGDPNYAAELPYADINFTCTFPLPANGVGNISADPAFVDLAGGNFRLRPNSPCIDSGTNLSALVDHDLEGVPRPLDGNGDGLAAFDIGAFEAQPSSQPYFISIMRVGDQLALAWKGSAGLKVQRTASLTKASWTDVPGSEGVSAINLPIDGEAEFFRLLLTE